MLKLWQEVHTPESFERPSKNSRWWETIQLLNLATRHLHCSVIWRNTCLQCGKRFVLFSDLKEHKRIHIGEEPFSCTTCEKKFALLCNLKQHQRTHAGEKPFSQPTNTVDQQQSPQQQQPSQQQSPPSSPPFHGWTPSECKPDMNKLRYETDEEEFEDLNECFYEPPSRLVTPRKRPAEDDDGSGESRNCRPRYNWTQFLSSS